MGQVGEKIMVAALTGVMGPVLGKLSSLIENKFTDLKNVRKKMELLRKELMAINLALEKHAAMESPDAQAKAWAVEMRELAYDMEDSINLFTHHVDLEPAATATATGVKSFFLNKIRKLKKLHYRYRFGKEIQQLHDLINEASSRRKRYKIGESRPSISHAEIDPRLQALYVEVEKLVGVDGPGTEIIDQLVDEDPAVRVRRRRVVSIVGCGGLGKTTLAKQVYEKIKGRFSCAAFVSVSQKPNMNKLLRDLYYHSGAPEWKRVGSCNDQQLIDQLRSYLQDKRYLVVIDDVWTEEAWQYIQCALPKNALKSSIIMTTRINSVGQFCCTSDEGFVYQMEPLSKSDSEILFLKRAFCSEDKFPIELEGIKNEILEKCDGLPLAIVTLASLLATKPRTKEEWERALNSIRCMHKEDSGLEVLHKILSLSYNDLPYYMRNCLLHLSTFPEDHEIYKDILIWRWIAEGFITERQGLTLEQVAESYFYELVNRSLVQPITFAGILEGCRVHDIILNFLICRSTEENFLTMLDGQCLPASNQRIRRLSTWYNQGNTLAFCRTMNLSHLRSFSVCYTGLGWMMSPVLDLPVLRVLDLQGCKFLETFDPNCILGCFHLRYLGLRLASRAVLPTEIGNLQYLQTIDLIKAEVRQLPKSIVRLKQLMRLVGDLLIMPDGFGNMESLQELGVLDGCKCSVYFGEDLSLLSKLRLLRVSFVSEGTSDMETRKESLMSSLCTLGANNLRCVYIKNNVAGGGGCFVDSWCPPPRLLQEFSHSSEYYTRFLFEKKYYSKFPKWINSCLCDLSYLDISVEKMERESLHILEDLPVIRSLYLDVKQVPEDGLIISHGGFRCLTRFKFNNIDGPGLVFEGGMQMLEWLKLGFNADKVRSTYGSLEVGIKQLSSLRYVHLTVRIISQGKNDPAEKFVKSVIDSQVKVLRNCSDPQIYFTRRSRQLT